MLIDGLVAALLSRVTTCRPPVPPFNVTPLKRTVPPSSLLTVRFFTFRKFGVLLTMSICASPGALSWPAPSSTSPELRMLPSLTVMSLTVTKSAIGPLAGVVDCCASVLLSWVRLVAALAFWSMAVSSAVALSVTTCT